MILISHRGNTNGINNTQENNPEYLKLAINKGFKVEMDISYSPYQKKLLFAHENTGLQFPFDEDFLYQNKDNLLIHCKDIESLCFFRGKIASFNFFFHENSDFTVSSLGWIIAHSKVTGNILEKYKTEMIQMLPERKGFGKSELTNYFGICSDFIEWYK